MGTAVLMYTVPIALSFIPWFFPEINLLEKILFLVLGILVSALIISISECNNLKKQLSSKQNEYSELQKEYSKLIENRDALKKVLEERDNELYLYKKLATRDRHFLETYIASPSFQDKYEIERLLQILKDEEYNIKERISNGR